MLLELRNTIISFTATAFIVVLVAFVLRLLAGIGYIAWMNWRRRI